MREKKIAFFITIVIAFSMFMGCIKTTEPSLSEIYSQYASQIVTLENNVVSPSGRYILKMKKSEKDGVSSFKFSIINHDNESVVYECEDYFRSRDVNYLLWGVNDTVWVYSGDLGTFYWENGTDGWEKRTYNGNQKNIEVPKVLKELRPEYFN